MINQANTPAGASMRRRTPPPRPVASPWSRAAIGACGAVALLLAAPAIAQDAEPPQEPANEASEQPQQQEQSQQEQPQEEADALPGLDELLGIEGDGEEAEQAPRELPEDPSRRELERRLEGEEVGEAFVEAVTLMGETADRLEVGRDGGVVTQRLQEDILRKLDQIIAASQSGQSGSSSSSQQQQQQQSQPDQQQQQQQTERGQQAENAQDPPTLQEGELAGQTPADAAAWGALRERVREALTQGTSDPFSSMYRSLTEAYYRRLAEGERR